MIFLSQCFRHTFFTFPSNPYSLSYNREVIEAKSCFPSLMWLTVFSIPCPLILKQSCRHICHLMLLVCEKFKLFSPAKDVFTLFILVVDFWNGHVKYLHSGWREGCSIAKSSVRSIFTFMVMTIKHYCQTYLVTGVVNVTTLTFDGVNRTTWS